MIIFIICNIFIKNAQYNLYEQVSIHVCKYIYVLDHGTPSASKQFEIKFEIKFILLFI